MKERAKWLCEYLRKSRSQCGQSSVYEKELLRRPGDEKSKGGWRSPKASETISTWALNLGSQCGVEDSRSRRFGKLLGGLFGHVVFHLQSKHHLLNEEFIRLTAFLLYQVSPSGSVSGRYSVPCKY
jgi:hypothetical protein